MQLGLAERLEEGSALTYNGSEYVLVELPFTQLPLYWEQVLFQLQLAGKQPVIAHPERQAQIQGNPGLLAGAVGRGVLTQITAGSLSRRFGSRVRKSAETLLKSGLTHVIASDAHGVQDPRSPDLLDGFNAAARPVGQEASTHMMTDLPRAIALGSPKLPA